MRIIRLGFENQVRLENGQVKKFFYIGELNCGWYLVQQFGEPGLRFMNEEGEVSEEKFTRASSYIEGFARIEIEGKTMYRDVIGRISPIKTESGKQIYNYLRGVITFRQLDKEFFKDGDFSKAVIKYERAKYKNNIRLHGENLKSLADYNLIRRLIRKYIKNEQTTTEDSVYMDIVPEEIRESARLSV